MGDIYKIYKEGEKGYETAIMKCDVIDVINVLDHTIVPERTKKVLVVKRNLEKKYDEPFYLYAGDYEDYIAFRSNYFPKEKQNKLGGLHGNKN